VLSRTNLANSFRRSTPNLRFFMRLRTLGRSCRGQVLWNQANAHCLTQEPGAGYARKNRPAESATYRLLPCDLFANQLPLHRFGSPLVSHCYELRFSQAVCFHNHLRCPLVFSCAQQNHGIGSRFPKSGIFSAPSASSVVQIPFTGFKRFAPFANRNALPFRRALQLE
jgi:hypothetical protein